MSISYSVHISLVVVAMCVRSGNKTAVYRCIYSLIRVKIWLDESHMLLLYLQNVNTCPVDRIKFNHIEVLSCKSQRLIRKV